MDRTQNFQMIKKFFIQKLTEIDYDGVIGVAEFKKVYDGLMPVQKSKLENICGEQFQSLMKHGSIICVGIAYPEQVIDCIDARLDNGTVDKDAWNTYAKKYHEINRILNAISKEIADSFGGILITATTGMVVENVEDYYGLTVSQRVIAENAGLGWRGKSELVVNEKYSCAIRFASVITSLPLIHGRKVKTSCGQCEACLEVCSVLKNKDRLENYRENCKKSMAQLDLETDVCGKCIKACYRNSIFSDSFKLR